MRRASTILATALLLPGGLGAQGIESEAAFLTIPTGARLVGMGRAGVALDDPQAAFYNPAIVALSTPPLAVHRYDGPLGFLVHHASAGLEAGALGTIQVGLQVQTFGEFEISDEAGSLGSWDPQNLIGSLALARSVGGGIVIGARGKWVASRVSPGSDGSGFVADAGLSWAVPRLPVRLAVAALDFGPDLTFDGVPTPLPTRIRAGVSGHVPVGDWSVLIAADADAAPDDLGVGGRRAGVGVGWRDAVSIRAGWVREKLIVPSDGYTLGLGVRLGRFAVDFAREAGVNNLGDEIHISLEYGQ